MTILPSPRAILFDWDNTLVDSWLCIQQAMNGTLRAMGHAEWTLEETKARVALSMRDSFPQMFGERWEEARDIFYQTFEAIHLDYLRPLPCAEEMLRQLSDMGLWLGVVSNKNGRFLRTEAARLGWDRYFDTLVGATDAPADKPHCAPVTLALDGSRIAPGPHVWFVGDALVDMKCAANSGLTPILMRTDAQAPGEFEAHPPLRHLDGCDAFASLVRELVIPISGN